MTGANRGLGFATTLALARRGARVVMACRDRSKGEAAAAEARSLVPGARLEVAALDLASLAAVRDFAAARLAAGEPLRALVNNAGPINALPKLGFTADGFEAFFGANHLGHFLLTNLLLPLLRAGAPSRVVVVSSLRHARVRAFDWDNLRGEKGYDQGAFYDRAKLANLWFAYALARRLEGSGVEVVAACPGFVPRTLMAGRIGARRLMFALLKRAPFARTPEAAGEDLARLAVDEGALAGARFFSSGRPARSSDLSRDEAAQERLWALSEGWTNLGPG